MNYIKENKEILLKYLYIIISNILLVILINFYLKNYVYKDIILLFITVIVDLIIYYYKGIKPFKIYLDIITNFIVGLILMLFIRNDLYYSYTLISIFLSNYIIFTRSRLKEKTLLKLGQYFSIIILMIINLFINLLIFNLVY